MVSSEEQQPTETNQPAPPPSPGGRRRRGRRGGRGRNRDRRQPAQAAGTDQPTEGAGGARSAPHAEGSTAKVGKNSSAISRAIDEARQIVESLEQVLEQMEEVRELIEVVERQKTADDHEIESLRRALRRIHHPHGSRQEPPAQAD